MDCRRFNKTSMSVDKCWCVQLAKQRKTHRRDIGILGKKNDGIELDNRVTSDI
jgi:hypothetical protein